MAVDHALVSAWVDLDSQPVYHTRTLLNTMLRLPKHLALGARYASSAAAASSSSSSSVARFSPLAMKAAEEVSSKWRGTNVNGGKTKNYIGGEFTESVADKWLEVRDPVRVIPQLR